jgi:hypothetical protein
MKTSKLLITALCGFTLASCAIGDFSEKDCLYRGILAAGCEWGHLTEKQQEPSYGEMQLFYCLEGAMPGMVRFDAPVCRRSLLTGTYDLLVFNRGDNPVRGLEKLSTAEIVAPVKEKNGKRYIDNCQRAVYSAVQSDVPIRTDDTTNCSFSPRPLVRQITIHLVIKGMESLPDITLLSGELEGVTTSRWLASGEKGGGYATLPFLFLPEACRERFSRSFLVLGIHGCTENTLRLKALFEGGAAGETSVSLDNVLDCWGTDTIEITIEVDVSPRLALTAAIAGWAEKDFGGITIQSFF